MTMPHRIPAAPAVALVAALAGGCAAPAVPRLDLDLERYTAEDALAANADIGSRIGILGPPPGDSMALDRAPGVLGPGLVTPRQEVGDWLFTSGDRNAQSFRADFEMIPRAALFPEAGAPEAVTFVSMQFHAAKGSRTTLRLGRPPEALEGEARQEAGPEDVLFLEIWERWLSAYALADPGRRQTLIPLELREAKDLSPPLPVWTLTIRLDPRAGACRLTLLGPRQGGEAARAAALLGPGYCRPEAGAERMSLVIESASALSAEAPAAPFQLLALTVSDRAP